MSTEVRGMSVGTHGALSLRGWKASASAALREQGAGRGQEEPGAAQA